MIKVENITKKYGNNVVLDNISLTVPDNQVLGFLGPNGAGKSTTMNIITGYISPTEGRVTVNEWDILQDPIQARTQIGYLPEQPPLYKDFTVWEYLSFAFGLKHCKLNKAAHLESICQDTGLTHIQKRLIKNLSKGYQQRVGIAQALIGNPSILIFDEPTVGLDPSQIIEIRNLIKRLGQSHTVILSSHILSEVQLTCSRIVVMNKGSIVVDSPAEELSCALSGDKQLTACIKGERDRVLSVVGTVAGVQAVQPKEDAYLITVSREADVCEALFYALARADLPLVGLCQNETSLEQLFLQLTEENNLHNPAKVVQP